MASMKRGDTTRVESLRLILSEVRNVAIAKYGRDAEAKVSDPDTVSAVKKLAKRHRESIEAFEKGGRSDLVAKEKAQLSVVESYLPQELPDSEIRKIIGPLLRTGETNFGVLMRQVMAAIAGKADGGRVSAILKEMLVKK